MPRHIVLVGLPGSGKSTVGRLVSEALPAPLIDVDALLVREMGMPISQIFGMVGEAKFRELERDAVNAAQGGAPGVIVPGGGWAAQPGQLEAAMATSLVVYLKCQPATATNRAGQGEARPVLAGGSDPRDRMRTLFEQREPFYKKAHHEVDAERRPAEAVATEIVGLARHRGGW